MYNLYVGSRPKTPPPLSKITRPRVQHEVLRRKLFRRLDAATQKPLVWITSPAGSGKTTLISSYIQERKLPCLWYRCDEGDGDPATFFHYMAMAARKANPRWKKPLPVLAPEYLADLSIFTRRYFEELFGRLKPPYLIVLDNHQTVPADSYFHEILAQGLDVIPEHITMAILSRHEPPPPLARLSAYDKMAFLRWNDIRFTLEETADVVNAGQRQKLSREVVLDVHQKADGWIAAIVLMLEQARLLGEMPAYPSEIADDKIFDYFADQIFSRIPGEIRDFLLKTAFLPTISVPMADELTGLGNAGRILSTLDRQNYFTQKLSGTGQDYQYHPLFRASLMSRAKSEVEPAALLALLGKAAQILTRFGRTEEAASLFVEIGDWNGLAGLLAETAKVFIIEGRNKTLEGYLRKLPEPMLHAAPRLLYWLGICRMPFDVEQSRALLEKAFQSFNDGGDIEWALASWAAVVDSIITEHNDYTGLDPWIEWLDNRDRLPESLPIEIKRETVAYMLFALTFRRPSDPKIGRWVERAEKLIGSGSDLPGAMIVGARLMLHYTFFGEVNKAELMLKNIAAPGAGMTGMRVLSLIQWQVITAGFAALGSASVETCLEAVKRGMALSREHGIHVFEPLLLYFGAVCCVASGDDAMTDKFLEEMVSIRAEFNEMHAAYYVSVHAWRDLMKGDARSAAERIALILPLTEKLGHTINTVANHVGLAHALFELGEKKKAQRHLASARALQGMDSPWLDYMLLATEAYFAFKEDRDPEGLELTRKAMAISRRRGVSVFVYWRPSMLALICSKALENGIETDHVKGLIRKHRLEPDAGCVESEHWPWPIRITTMGSFQVLLDDAPLEFSGKTPQKPLELLKVLIAFGGKNVPEERLSDSLWPDDDGDRAHQSLEITLRRLRHLLGGDGFLKYGARTLSIDRQSCWVDSLALENILNRSEGFPNEQVAQRYREAANLYKGHFLPSEAGREWAISRGETLQSRMLHLIEEAGRLHERGGEWDSAGFCYQKGLDIDNLAEDFYRRLMVCYMKLGRRAEAIRLYHRCRSTLKAQLGVGPSPETEATYSSLLQKK